MKNADPDKIRNVGIIAHSGAGKTSLAEALLYDAGATSRLGSVDQKNSLMDFSPEEIARQISISSALASCFWEGHKINIVDTPGDQNFVTEALLSMSAIDSAIVIISAVSGIKAQTDKVWQWACDHNLARLIFINKLDNDKASYETAFGQIDSHFHQKTLKLTLPIGSGAGFTGVVDLLTMRAYLYKRDGEGTFADSDIPDNLLKWAQKERQEMVESVAETDDDLLEKFMENETLSDEDLYAGLRSAVIAGTVVPVLCGSATQNIVVRKTLNAIVKFLPSPLDVPAHRGTDGDSGSVEVAPDPAGQTILKVFKTVSDPFSGKLSFVRVCSGSLAVDTNLVNSSKGGAKERSGTPLYIQGKKHEQIKNIGFGDVGALAKLKSAETGDTLCAPGLNIVLDSISLPAPVLSVAVEIDSKKDEEKLSTALGRLREEDPALVIEMDRQTGELILSGMGQLHLESVQSRLREKYSVSTHFHPPRIAYMETITKKAKGHGRLKKQSGGHGQFADCSIEIEPIDNGADFEFVNATVGGSVPRQYVPGVEKGVRETMQAGVWAGYPVTSCKVTLYDGKHHDVDSSEMAFKIAAGMAFKSAFEKAGPRLLEPVMEMEIVVPEESVGDVMSDLSQKRGQVVGIGVMGGNQRVKAHVPLAEILEYVKDLRSITGGRGNFTQHFFSYQEVPTELAQKIALESGHDH